MKKQAFLIAVFSLTLFSCSGVKVEDKQPIVSEINLDNVVEDRVEVKMNPGKFDEEEVTFYLPQIVPGTYQISDFGQFIKDFKAYDYDGNELSFAKPDVNTWVIEKGQQLDRISYWVDDTFDGEKHSGIYSMSGTSNEEGKAFLLNLHGYIGYFKGLKENNYLVTIESPDVLKPYSALNRVSSSNTKDVFSADRYFKIIDNPILYTNSDAIGFDLDEIKVNFAVYSPTGKHKAADYQESLKKMMKGQKAFLKEANSTKQYDILFYLTTPEENTFMNYALGALEHHTSTVVVLSEDMTQEQIAQNLTDIVSHEFFHTLTPLNVHSEEIHYFDFNDPQLSQHLWMYEGTTEYFANLFQVNQGLIDEKDFLNRMSTKITQASRYNDAISFTKMSENVLDSEYEKQYGNVYLKGALINMCLDILIRDKSNGEKGVLSVMTELSKKYGVEKPFMDESLISEYTALTYPEVGEFFNAHVIGDTPIQYNDYFAKVGIGTTEVETNLPGVIMSGPSSTIFTPDSAAGLLKITALNTSIEALGVKKGDFITKVNDVDFSNLQDPKSQGKAQKLFEESFSWSSDKDISITIKRDDKELELKGKVGKPTVKVKGFGIMENSTKAQTKLRNSWLKD